MKRFFLWKLSEEQERNYRLRFLKQDARILAVTAVMMIVNNIMLFFVDGRFVEDALLRLGVAGARCVMIVLSLGMLWVCLTLDALPSDEARLRRYDRTALLWAVGCVVMFSLVSLSRLPDNPANSTQFDLFVMLVLMMVMPDRGGWRWIPSFQLLVQQVGITLCFANFPCAMQAFSMGFIYLTFYLFGAVISTQFFSQRRQLFQLSESSLKLQREAEAAAQAKSEFIALVSHEIRTPLNVLKGAYDLVLTKYGSFKHHESFKMMGEALASLIALIEDVFDLSKIESGQLSIEEAPCALRPFFASVIDPYLLMAQKRHLRLSYALEEGLPEWILTDAVRLRQIVVNLINNALKFTYEGEIKIGVAKRTGSSQEMQWLYVSVEDTGIGISEEQMAHLFDRFYQVDASLTRQEDGMGLGLPLSQGLAHKLGGDIQVESEPGKGSRFVFQMPLVETEPLNAPGEEADLIAAESKRQNLSILVVEDNHFSRIILGDQLKQMGHRVVLAEEGEQALVQYHANAFDLVFLDLRMPGMTGLEVAETIRRSEKTQGRQRTPLVMITAEVTASLLKDADQAGIDYTLTKPVSVEVLKTVINEVFGQAVARRDGGQFVGNQPESGLADGSQPKESVVAGDPSEEERGVDADIQLHPRLMSDFAQTPSRAVHYREMLLRDLIAQLQPLVGALAEGRVDVVSECVHALKSLINQVAAGCFTQTWSQFLAARSANLQSVQQEKALLLTAVCEQALQQAQIQHHVQKQQQGMDSTL